MDKRVEALMKKMTLQEKIDCAACLDDKIANVERLGVPGYFTCDNTNPGDGMRDFTPLSEEERLGLSGFFGTAFPQMAVLGSTWDEDIVYEVADAQGQEAKYGNVGVLLRPGANMKRSPLCGRNFEYYSEDPVLAGELAGTYIQGIQKNKVAACLKHFAANSQEFERMSSNAVISDRALHELYLRVFEIAIKKGDPWTIMTSYNKINGEYVHANKEVLGILRDEYGYDGVVMSDCMAVHYEKVKGHQAGLDVELDESYIHNYQLHNAIEQGSYSEKELDVIVRRVLETYYKIVDDQIIPESIDMEAHHRLAVRAAEEGSILLKNANILPLSPDSTEKLALIGKYAKAPSYMGGGSGHMNGITIDCAYDSIMKIVKNTETISYTKGYEVHEGTPPVDVINETLIAEAVEVAKNADKVILFTGYDFGLESEGYDRVDMLLPKSHRLLIDKVLEVNENVILVINTGAAVELASYADKVKAILYGGYSGEGVGSSEANILFGLAEPGGRLAETFPYRIEDTPAFLNFPNYPNPMHEVVYGEDIYIGYRWYDTRKIDVLYPFGYGLSYTTFEYDNLKINMDTCHPDDKVVVSLTVKNTGERRGSDVVQLYIAPKEHMIGRPAKELKAFKKVHLDSKQMETVIFELSRREFETYASGHKKWIVEPGKYEILIGRSSQDIKMTTAINMLSKERAYSYDGKSAGIWIMNSKNFEKAANETFSLETQDFFANSRMATLCSSLPWDRFTEVNVGQGDVDNTQVYDLIQRIKELDLNDWDE